MRRVDDGLFDRAAEHGEITGSGPNFDSAMAMFQERQRQLGLVGIWRCQANQWHANNGTYIDRDWDVIDL